MEPTPGSTSTEYDAALLAQFNGPADVERFGRLFLLWCDVLNFVKNRPLEDRKVREITPDRLEYAQTQAALIKRLREEYPGVKPAPMPRSKLAPEYQKMLRSAKQAMRMPRHTLVHPEGPALVIQSLELHMKMRAQADELNGLVMALSSRKDAPHQLALLKAMAKVGVELEPE
jgi:hypothetical protein